MEGRLPEDGVEPEAFFAIPKMTLRASPNVLILPASFAGVAGVEVGGFLLLSDEASAPAITIAARSG